MDDAGVQVWRYDAGQAVAPDIAELGDPGRYRGVLVAAAHPGDAVRAWMAVDDYDASEATLLFGVPAGDEFLAYLRALLPEAIELACELGFSTLVAHWRAGWASGQSVLAQLDFVEAAPGLWRRAL